MSSSVWPPGAAHPTQQPSSKHDLFGPPSLLSDDDVPAPEQLNSVGSIASALTSSDGADGGGGGSAIASVYTYPDGPHPKRGDEDEQPFGRNLLIVGVAPSYLDVVRRTLDRSDENNGGDDGGKGGTTATTTRVRKCTVGVHRADGDYGKRLPSEKRSNSDNFARIVEGLWRDDAVAVVRLDATHAGGATGGGGRFGFLAPPSDLRERGVDELGVGMRGSYAALCHYAPVDDWMKEFAPPSPSGAGGENGDDDDGPTFRPDDDDDDGDRAATTGGGGGDDTAGEESLWQPPGGGDDDDNAADGGTSSLWQPPGGGDDDDTPAFGATDGNNGYAGRHSEAQRPTNGGVDEKKGDDDDTFHANEGAAAADRFYSGLTREQGSRADSRLFHMRAFNGWVKACQIAELNPRPPTNKKRKREGGGKLPPLRVLDLACGKGGDLGKWTIHPRGVGRYVGVDVARGSLHDAAIRAVRMGRKKLPDASFVCADLGEDVPGRCRRGKKADMLLTWKFTPEAEAELEDENHPKFVPTLGGGVSPEERFDVVSIQFAIHYMMSTRRRARRFFRTVSDLLEIGGNLICTTIDARVVVLHLMNLGLDLESMTMKKKSTDDDEGEEEIVVMVGDGACRLKFDTSTVMRIFGLSSGDEDGGGDDGGGDDNGTKNKKKKSDGGGLDKHLRDSNFGLQYTFTLVEGEDHAAGVGEAVDLPEWLTPLPVLRTLASEAGLELTSVENFHEFFITREDVGSFPLAHAAMYNMKVLARDGSISRDEWEISRMYAAMKFTKVRESSVVLEEGDEEDDENDEEEEEDEEQRKEVRAPAPAPAAPRGGNAGGGKYALALMKAKRSAGDEAWKAMTPEQKKAATMSQLAAL